MVDEQVMMMTKVFSANEDDEDEGGKEEHEDVNNEIQYFFTLPHSPDASDLPISQPGMYLG